MVSIVDRYVSSFIVCEEIGNDFVVVRFVDGKNFISVVSGDIIYVVVDGGKDGDGLFVDIDIGENVGCFRDIGEMFGKNFGGKVVELEVDVVFFGIDVMVVMDFYGYGVGDDVMRGKIFGGRGIFFYEMFIFGVEEVVIFIMSIFSD